MHNIALVNIADGSVQGHKAGCADLHRGALRKHADDVWEFEVATKHDAWVSYNIDFLNEGPESGQYSIEWKNCSKHVPQGADDTYEAWAAEDAEAEVEGAFAEAAPKTEVKRGSKWTYVYVDGKLVAEIRNDQAHLLAAI